MPETRVIIADHQLVAEGLRRILEPEFCVVGILTSGLKMLRGGDPLPPDIVLLDLSLARRCGAEWSMGIRNQNPHIKVILLTPQNGASALGYALRIGAAGLVLKQQSPNELRKAIRTVAGGRQYMAPAMQSYLAPARPVQPVPAAYPAAELTGRQKEVLELLAAGRTTKEIGSHLRISPKTVEFHKAGLKEQLGLRGTAAFTRFAVEHGMMGGA